LCEQVAAEGFPLVAVGEHFEQKVSCVYADSNPSSREAVQYLLDLGHRRIAICLNDVEDSDHQDRLRGYREALTAREVAFDPQLVLRASALRDCGVQVMRRLYSVPNRPTAIYFADPLTALGAINEARLLGLRVPEDMSIIGFDDAEVRLMVHPTMTAVCQDAKAIGREAVSVLRALLDEPGGAAPVRRVLSTWLEVHETTAALAT
jgi:DNA-binding LacI/PurR family transcriptional regulator